MIQGLAVGLTGFFIEKAFGPHSAQIFALVVFLGCCVLICVHSLNSGVCKND